MAAGGVKMRDPNGGEHVIVPAGVAALVTLGWSKVESKPPAKKRTNKKKTD